MSGMEKVLYFGVIGRSSHLMWADETSELLPLPSNEYVNRQKTKTTGQAPSKRTRNHPRDANRSGWILADKSCLFLPWPMIDCALCPGVRHVRQGDEIGDVQRRFQVEGQCVLHYRDGWTALAWWDRSGREGYWSNSALFAQGAFTVDEMLAMGRAQFPCVMGRMTYPFTRGVFSDVSRHVRPLPGEDVSPPCKKVGYALSGIRDRSESSMFSWHN